MPSATPATDIRTPTPSQPGVPGLADELTDLGSGIGLLTVALFGAVPGFLPVVALTVVAGVIILIPLLAVGLVTAVIAVPLLLIKWIVARVAAYYRGQRPAPPRPRSRIAEHGGDGRSPCGQLIGPARERQVALLHRSAQAHH